MKRIIMVFLTSIFILTFYGCQTKKTNPFEEAIRNFYSETGYGYDYSMVQMVDDTITNAIEVEQRISYQPIIKSYTWIKSQSLESYDYEDSGTEEIIYYYQEPSQLIVEENDTLTIDTISYNLYQKINRLPKIEFRINYLENDSIIQSDNQLEAIIQTNSIADIFPSMETKDIQEAKISITINDFKLTIIEIIIIQTLSTTKISISPYQEETTVIIPNVE